MSDNPLRIIGLVLALVAVFGSLLFSGGIEKFVGISSLSIVAIIGVADAFGAKRGHSIL